MTKMTQRVPAFRGGKPLFAKPIPITQPTVPSTAALGARFKQILKSRLLTNGGTVKDFEAAAARYLGVKHVVAVNSCTSGLILAMKSLGLTGEVIMPSFTFHATAHACAWNGLTPVFVDCDPDTYAIDPLQVERAITDKTSAIVGVHIFGCPAPVEELAALARKRNLKLIYDAAHALGSLYKGRHCGGFGDAEVFSLSPTKLVTSAEGGLVATNDSELARKLRVGRNYGDPGTYDCEYSGLNARMSELHAAVGIESLKLVEKNVRQRLKLAALYSKRLLKLPGLTLQTIPEGCRTTYKDFSILVDADAFGMTRDELHDALLKENVIVKKYFYPPAHQQKLFQSVRRVPETLPETERVASTALSLPLYSHMTPKDVDLVMRAVEDIARAVRQPVAA